jgi:hypothetical protein
VQRYRVFDRAQSPDHKNYQEDEGVANAHQEATDPHAFPAGEGASPASFLMCSLFIITLPVPAK